jgi:hypothetical protein
MNFLNNPKEVKIQRTEHWHGTGEVWVYSRGGKTHIRCILASGPQKRITYMFFFFMDFLA